jgi:hypothetical protein
MKTEKNKLIAEFMGIVFTKDNKANHPRIKAPYPPIECFNYHSDWNWLIEVVEKIKPLNRNGNHHYSRLMNMTLIEALNIDYLYSNVVAFIEWYNENK